jgi:hypothetical protein
MLLAAGERAQKPLSPEDLEPGQWGEASWLLRPLRRREDMDVAFSFLLRCANAPELSCSDPLAVPGSPKTDTLRLPRDLLFRYGDKIWIPLRIDRTVGKDLSSYAIDLSYDPSVLSLVTVSGAGTLTAYGWVGARLERLGDGHARISDYTTGSPLRDEAGTLVRLYTEGVYSRRDQGSFGATELRIDTAATLLNGGEIAVRAVDGLAYVTNDCLEPLTAGAGYELRQNTPNPFNPSTDITFTLPAPARVRLAVLDRLGRELRLAADGEFAAGEHRVRFTVDGLPSGIYFYLLDTPFGQRVRSMLLAR